MSTVDFPDLKTVTELGPEGYITEFYQQLGWKPGTELQPTSVVINDERWKDVCEGFNKLEGFGAVPSFIWMNIGPSASKDVPYDKIEVDLDNFNRDMTELSPAEVATLDRTIRENFTVEGNVVHLEANRSETNELLLQDAYDARAAGPETYMEILRARIDELWEGDIDLAAIKMIGLSGIAESWEPQYETAFNHIMSNYTIEPPYSHYLDQDMRVNILLGTSRERNADFTCIHVMGDNLLGANPLRPSDLDNGLAWLVKQQDHTMIELKHALADYDKWGFDAAEITHGTFLASVAQEMRNFPNVMGTVTVLTSLSMSQLGQTLDKNDVLTIPKDATIGIFAPWAGGGSGLDIQLEKDLDITADVRFDVQIEGARNDEYTVQDVYGLVDEAWKEPSSIRFSEIRPLDELIAEAKEKAAERKSINHLETDRTRKAPEIER